MSSDKQPSLSSLSQGEDPGAIGEFWDSHSLADYWDETREVDFDVKVERRRRVTLAPEVYAQIEAAARKVGLLPETLVNLWLAERLRQATG